MNIIQTLWTGRKDLLKDEFGWIDPEYHIMSWALSCSKIREFYDNCVLYTDSQGKHILIDVLNLPYTDVKVVYDNLKCRPTHWAYPKIVTYSLQDEPFIHIDGDVILAHPLNGDIINAQLVAQNKEIISDYYKDMLNDIRRRGTMMPECLNKDIEKGLCGSYNAGVLGGTDIQFIKEYCNQAYRIIDDNHMNEPTGSNISVNNNILFEQILFYSLVKQKMKEVRTIIPRDIQDNGYSYDEFANFYRFGQYPLIHMLGGHKRNIKTCCLMEKELLNTAPDVLEKIKKLFKTRYSRLYMGKCKKTDFSVQTCVAEYHNWLDNKIAEWNSIPSNELYTMEKYSCLYLDFIRSNDKEKFTLYVNPNVKFFMFPDTWRDEAKFIIKERINNKRHMKKNDVAAIPSLYSKKGYNEILINDIQYNILILADKDITIKRMKKLLMQCISDEIKKKKIMFDKLLDNELEYLFFNKLLFVKKHE